MKQKDWYECIALVFLGASGELEKITGISVSEGIRTAKEKGLDILQ